MLDLFKIHLGDSSSDGKFASKGGQKIRYYSLLSQSVRISADYINFQTRGQGISIWVPILMVMCRTIFLLTSPPLNDSRCGDSLRKNTLLRWTSVKLWAVRRVQKIDSSLSYASNSVSSSTSTSGTSIVGASIQSRSRLKCFRFSSRNM